MIGSVRMSMVRVERVGSRLIAFIWSCTNFLAPKTNG